MVDKDNFMLCKECDIEDFVKLYDTSNYGYEIKFDGVRNFCIIKKGEVVGLLNRLGHNRIDRFEHFKKDRFGDFDLVLDGEVVVINEDYITRLPLVNSSENWSKAKFIVFDILSLNGVDTTILTYSKRRILLCELFSNFINEDKNFALSPMFDDLKIWEVVKTRDLEGLIAKRLNSKYLGVRSDSWVKLKNWKNITKKVEKYEITENNGFVIYVNVNQNHLQKVVVNGINENRYIKENFDRGKEVYVDLRYLHEEDIGLRELVFKGVHNG